MIDSNIANRITIATLILLLLNSKGDISNRDNHKGQKDRKADNRIIILINFKIKKGIKMCNTEEMEDLVIFKEEEGRGELKGVVVNKKE